jgi:hypothetical protein
LDLAPDQGASDDTAAHDDKRAAVAVGVAVGFRVAIWAGLLALLHFG